uniref:Uncharacterized protein n=1 Tax=Arundo donax TaxID=35708 RepID=A0A0A9FV03_ARUDO
MSSPFLGLAMKNVSNHSASSVDRAAFKLGNSKYYSFLQ